MEQKAKRFQTGREIMEHFVPDYAASDSAVSLRDQLDGHSGAQLGEDLTARLRERLAAAKLKTSRKRADP